jgi:hypothetical protein
MGCMDPRRFDRYIKKTVMTNYVGDPLDSPEDHDVYENPKFLCFARQAGLMDRGKMKGIPESRLAQVSKPQGDVCLAYGGRPRCEDPLAVWRFMKKFFHGKYFPDDNRCDFIPGVGEGV